MEEYVKDYTDRREDNRRDNLFSKVRWLWFLVFLLVLFFIFIFPHKQYVYSSTYGKKVLGVNGITGIACYLDLEWETENVDGEKTGWYNTKEKRMIHLQKDKVLGVEVYYNESEDILVEVDEEEKDSEFSNLDIFLQIIFSKEQFKKQSI